MKPPQLGQHVKLTTLAIPQGLLRQPETCRQGSWVYGWSEWAKKPSGMGSPALAIPACLTQLRPTT